MERPDAAAAMAPAPELAGGEGVLVVDDDPDIARFIEVNLRTHGFDVHLAKGVEALERAYEVRPALVLVDVVMPRMAGSRSSSGSGRIPERPRPPSSS